MAPSLFSPSELSYLHTSLSLDTPVRPDARLPNTFRPLRAEIDIVPSANGSARLCFADGSEAIVGVKGEVQKSTSQSCSGNNSTIDGFMRGVDAEERASFGQNMKKTAGEASWLDITIDVPGQRDDDNMVVFLGQLLHEGLVGDGALEKRLYINSQWHWKLFVDILLLSTPQSFPLPLLSLTTHLALLSTRMPALISSEDEDPLFDDDWEASLPIYGVQSSSNDVDEAAFSTASKPPIVLLVIAVADNIFFDPSSEELAVADAVVAVTIAPMKNGDVRALAVRTICSPSRLAASIGGPEDVGQGFWRPRSGGVGRKVIAKMVLKCVEQGGVGQEVLRGLG